jgi:hypothetical protein
MPKTLSDIIPPSRRRQMEPEGGMATPSYEPPRRRSRGGKFPYGFLLVAVLVIAACGAALMLFSGASIKVTPTVNETAVSGEWTATPTTGDLPFETVSIDQVASEEVAAEGTETANVPAQGSITIFNAQEKKQELIKNTRFESPDGKIFRIRESIVVPAGTAENPGTLKATVYADAAGDQYNIGPSTFTLPGLKGSKLYDLVYAKSEEAMKGGFTGTRPSVSEASRQAKYDSMRPKLETELMEALSARVPEGYILVPGSTAIAYEPQPDAESTSSSVKAQLKGTATAFVFPNEALAKALAYRLIAKYNGQPVMLAPESALTLTHVGDEPATPGMASYAFNLSGNAVIVWKIDPAAITEAIAGKSRDAAKTILKGFPEIGEASIVLRPFWDGTLPENPTEIEVVEERPEIGN